MDLDQSRFWVVDVEGNGASPPEIVELAMVEVVGLDATTTARHWLIRPEAPISLYASRIHGLTNADVAGAPALADIEDDLLGWLNDAVIVGHNVKVEVDILRRGLPEWAPAGAIDTLKLSRALLPDLGSHALLRVGEALDHVQEAASRSGQSHHGALFDATLTALIFVDLARQALASGRGDLVDQADILARRQGQLL